MQELLFQKNLKDTRKESIYTAVKQLINEKTFRSAILLLAQPPIQLHYCVRTSGFCFFRGPFKTFLQHCGIHRQHIVVKNLSIQLNKILNIVILTVNKKV